MEFLRQKDVLLPRQEAQIIVEEYSILCKSQAEKKMKELSKAWGVKRRIQGLSEEMGPTLEVHTPSGWIMRSLIKKDHLTEGDFPELVEAEYVETQGSPHVICQWEFDHFTLIHLVDRKRETAYKALRAQVNSNSQIICTFLSKEVEEQSVRSRGTRVFNKDEWQADSHGESLVATELRRLFRSHVPFPQDTK